MEMAKPAPPRRDRSVLTSPAIRRMQLLHFLAFDVAPFAGVIVAIAGWPKTAPSALDLSLFFLLWAATGLGLTVGYHRRFSHRSFQCGPGVDAALIVMASMAARGPMFSWAAMHRRHHERSDREGDMHSPNLAGTSFAARLRGFAHAHFTWMARHDYPNAGYYIPDLLQQPALVRWNRRYYGCVVAGLALPALIGGLATGTWAGAASAFLWGGVLRLFVVEHTMNAINSLGHLLGDRPFARGADRSRNMAWASIASWGEAWHNNHHAFPWSAAFGLGARQPDPGLWFIRALERLGLAWDVKRPDPARIAARVDGEGAERAGEA